MATEGMTFGPGGSDSDLADLARLADDLVHEIATARRHYDELRAALDEPKPADDPDAGPSLDDAHLAALSMALTGSSREDARAHLCVAFAIDDDDAAPIVDEAFGVRFEDADETNGSRRRFERATRERV